MIVSCCSSLEKPPLAEEPWPTSEILIRLALELATSTDCYVTQVDAPPVAAFCLQQKGQSSLGGYEKGVKVADRMETIKHEGSSLVKVNRISNCSLLNLMP